METKVSKNIVEPRSYQLYGDDIESKQAVEPIALVGGTGPICGFNYIDVSDDTRLIISGLSNPNMETISVSDDEEVVRTRDPRRWLSTKANKSGVVVNAYTTPDGLVHIAPDVLTFNFGPEGGWPRVNGEPDKAVIFALKAKHTYSDQEGVIDTPSQDNFEVTWVDDTDIPFLKLVNGSYQYLLENILPKGWLDTNTESFLGLYIVGWNSTTWNKEYGEGELPVSDYESLISSSDIGYKLCLVPYRGIWPVTAFTQGPLEYLVDRKRYIRAASDIAGLKSNIVNINNKFKTTEWVPDRSILTRMINDSAITTDKIADSAITTSKIANKSVTNDKIADFSINTSKLANKSVNRYKLAEDLSDISNYRLRYYNIQVTGTSINDVTITSPVPDELIGLFKVGNIIVTPTNDDVMTIELHIGTHNVNNISTIFLPGTITGNVYTPLIGSFNYPFLKEVTPKLMAGGSEGSGLYDHYLNVLHIEINHYKDALANGLKSFTICISALTNRGVTVY